MAVLLPPPAPGSWLPAPPVPPASRPAASCLTRAAGTWCTLLVEHLLCARCRPSCGTETARQRGRTERGCRAPSCTESSCPLSLPPSPCAVCVLSLTPCPVPDSSLSLKAGPDAVSRVTPSAHLPGARGSLLVGPPPVQGGLVGSRQGWGRWLQRSGRSAQITEDAWVAHHSLRSRPPPLCQAAWRPCPLRMHCVRFPRGLLKERAGAQRRDRHLQVSPHLG